VDEYARNYAVALPLFIVLDFAWIGFVMKDVYLRELGSLARTFDGVFKPNIAASLLAWALIPLGIVVFAVPRLSPDSTVPEVIGWGALFGGITYGIYDLTNLATLRDYSPRLTLIDTAWGAVLSAAITLIVWVIAK
jgi:uncharacterized membrane protein